MNNKNDELVLQFLAKVKEKKSEISAVSKPNWQTSCSISLEYSSNTIQDRVNIQTITDLDKLVNLYSFLAAREEAFKKAAKELGLTIPAKYMGYTFEDWKTDIKFRVDQVNINSKKKELQELEDRINRLVTPEQRRELELEEIRSILG